MRSTPTMWDVARVAGVSQATVSLVLNGVGRPRVSDATRARVQESAKALGYRANATAKALRDGVSELIGFIGDEVASAPFAGKIVEGAQERAWQDEQLMLVVNTSGSAEIERTAIEQMLSHQVYRFIYASMYNRPLTPPPALLRHDVVILNAIDPTGATPSVSPDELLGGREATEHLIDAGHRRIAMIDIETLESGLPAAVGRHEGYQQALRTAGLPADPSLVKFGGGDPDDGFTLTRELMARDEPPTAIFCANDRTAWGAYQALQQLGLRVPDDVSIIGFDNQETLAPFLHPPLTTMNLPFREMGWAAADLLLAGAGGAADASSRSMQLHCDVVVRGSVGSPRENP